MRNSVAKKLRRQASKEVKPDAPYYMDDKRTVYCGNPRKRYLWLKTGHNKTEVFVKSITSKRQKRLLQAESEKSGLIIGRSGSIL